MKQYKLLEGLWMHEVESQINNLADNGWVVKSFNVSFEGEENSNPRAFALLEYDDFDHLESMKGIYERLGRIFDKIGSTSSGTDLFKIHDDLYKIVDHLESIELNTQP